MSDGCLGPDKNDISKQQFLLRRLKDLHYCRSSNDDYELGDYVEEQKWSLDYHLSV